MTEQEARANVHLDLTMSTDADIDALIAAVRADTLMEVRGVVEGMERHLDGYDGCFPFPDGGWISRDDTLAALDALAHPEGK